MLDPERVLTAAEAALLLLRVCWLALLLPRLTSSACTRLLPLYSTFLLLPPTPLLHPFFAAPSHCSAPSQSSAPSHCSAPHSPCSLPLLCSIPSSPLHPTALLHPSPLLPPTPLLHPFFAAQVLSCESEMGMDYWARDLHIAKGLSPPPPWRQFMPHAVGFQHSGGAGPLALTSNLASNATSNAIMDDDLDARTPTQPRRAAGILSGLLSRPGRLNDAFAKEGGGGGTTSMGGDRDARGVPTPATGAAHSAVSGANVPSTVRFRPDGHLIQEESATRAGARAGAQRGGAQPDGVHNNGILRPPAALNPHVNPHVNPQAARGPYTAPQRPPRGPALGSSAPPGGIPGGSPRAPAGAEAPRGVAPPPQVSVPSPSSVASSRPSPRGTGPSGPPPGFGPGARRAVSTPAAFGAPQRGASHQPPLATPTSRTPRFGDLPPPLSTPPPGGPSGFAPPGKGTGGPPGRMLPPGGSTGPPRGPQGVGAPGSGPPPGAGPPGVRWGPPPRPMSAGSVGPGSGMPRGRPSSVGGGSSSRGPSPSGSLPPGSTSRI